MKGRDLFNFRILRQLLVSHKGIRDEMSRKSKQIREIGTEADFLFPCEMKSPLAAEEIF